MSKNLYYIIGGLVIAIVGIGYTISSSKNDTSNSSVKEPRSANSNVRDYRKGIISDYCLQTHTLMKSIYKKTKTLIFKR